MKAIQNIGMALLLGCPAAVQAQFTITGDVPGLSDGMIYLQTHGKSIDSTKVAGGKFFFKGGRTEVTYCTVMTADRKWGGMFWLSNDDIRIALSADGNIEITGAPEEDLYQLYRKHMEPVWAEGAAMQQRAGEALKAGNREEMNRINACMEKEYKEKEDSLFLVFADAHPSACICLNHIYNCRAMSKYSYPRYSRMLARLTPGAFSGQQWETMQEYCRVEAALEPGHPFPEIAMNDVYGTEHKVSDYRGKWLLVTFGNGTLQDYAARMPFRKSLYGKYHAQGFDELDILLVKGKKDIVKTGATFGMPWTLVSDLKSWDTPLVKTMHMDHIGQDFLIAPDGTVAGRNLSDEELERMLEEAFAK